MAKTPETVAKFLKDLTEKLRVLQTSELETFKAYKKEEVRKRQTLKPFDTRFNEAHQSWVGPNQIE